MQSTINPALYAMSILLPTGEINKDKINLISGATTTTFIETLWEVSGNNADALNRLYTILSDLYEQEREDAMMEILRLLYDTLGMGFPDDVALLAEHAEARNYYLFELLLEYFAPREPRFRRMRATKNGESKPSNTEWGASIAHSKMLRGNCFA